MDLTPEKELEFRLAEAGAHGDPAVHLLSALERFKEIHVPKKLPDPKREESALKQISARLPESVIAEADRIGELLSYSRNEIIIKAISFYCESVAGEIRSYAVVHDAHCGDQNSLLDVVDGQLDIFEGGE